MNLEHEYDRKWEQAKETYRPDPAMEISRPLIGFMGLMGSVVELEKITSLAERKSTP